jgi:hypothetical protein
MSSSLVQEVHCRFAVGHNIECVGDSVVFKRLLRQADVDRIIFCEKNFKQLVLSELVLVSISA